MGIHRNPLSGETYESLGREIMESYIANLSSHQEDRKLMLHNWHISEEDSGAEEYKLGHGIVTGHQRLSDSVRMHTSDVRGIEIDEVEGELILTTRNSVYHCPLSDCNFDRQDQYPGIIPEYEKLKQTYKDTVVRPSVEPGKVLLVLSNFCEYYFHSLCYVPAGSENGVPLSYKASPHIGMFQDSFLIRTDGWKIDLRYFPHYQNVEFYGESTDGCPWYIENTGDAVLFAKTSVGTIRLAPGERKEVQRENTEENPPMLPRGDLYPAGIIK
ncbi:MAG: hypothetical protein K6E75_03135 [Lachnospiraceae bacterium]|nr:hypothetical protein [Lachnospiraceae bacterium]